MLNWRNGLAMNSVPKNRFHHLCCSRFLILSLFASYSVQPFRFEFLKASKSRMLAIYVPPDVHPLLCRTDARDREGGGQTDNDISTAGAHPFGGDDPLAHGIVGFHGCCGQVGQDEGVGHDLVLTAGREEGEGQE